MLPATGISHTLVNFSIQYPVLVYGFIIAVGIVEGPILSILLGTLLRLGYFSILPVYLSLMAGDLIGDTLWYSAGYFYGRGVVLKLGKFIGITEKHIEKVETMFRKNKTSILFLSKVTNGFGLSVTVIVTAGISKIPYKKFILINFFGQVFWSALLLAAGYFFGTLYAIIPSVLGKITLALGAIILAIIIFLYIKRRNKKNANR